MRRASIVIAAWILSCGSGRTSGFETTNPESVGGNGAGGELGQPSGGTPADLPQDPTADPTSCEEAKVTKSYVGCDYWPTVTANGVWSLFDFAVVVSNVGGAPADVAVT